MFFLEFKIANTEQDVYNSITFQNKFIYFFLLFSIKFDIRRTAFCWKGDLVCFVFVVKLLCQWVFCKNRSKEIYEEDIRVSSKVD